MSTARWDARLAEAVKTAVANVVEHGDTDLFSEPPEHAIFASEFAATESAVMALHRQFEDAGPLPKTEVLRALFPAGQHGFRLGSQIEPVWNLYLLSVVILAAPSLESSRPSLEEQTVHSYRFTQGGPPGRLFNPALGWRSFIQATVQLCDQYPVAVVCDIADFYQRISPNIAFRALRKCSVQAPLARRIGQVLSRLQAGRYGLPVGGPASRLIAEAVLAPIDAMLARQGIRYCRFVDDFRLFFESESQARHALAWLSAHLFDQGMSLQKAKSRILSGKELLTEISLRSSTERAPSKQAPAPHDHDLLSRLAQSAALDPYSGLRASRDDRLEAFARQTDAFTILCREFSKSRLDLGLARNLLSSIGFMEAGQAQKSLLWLLDPARRGGLEPVMGKLLLVTSQLAVRLRRPAQAQIASLLLDLVEAADRSYRLPATLAQAIRALSASPPGQVDEARRVLQRCYDQHPDPIVRREIVLLWGLWKDRGAITTLAAGPRPASAWVRRALIGALKEVSVGPEISVPWIHSTPMREHDITSQLGLGAFYRTNGGIPGAEAPA